MVEGQRFPRSCRLTTQADYAAVFACRRVLRGRTLMLHLGEPRPVDSPVSSARLGLVVAKKFLKRAAGRNVLKRLIREQFRRTRASLPPRDLVFRLMGKLDKPKSRADKAALAEEIHGLLLRVQSQ
ncbi:MAG: ribonuclease P protein component [Zoogloeaceae bacterium]|jgi:ribonuclease P protein component|nr:ribonuclease P protein component [Zoogloeaceae bacterium]